MAAGPFWSNFLKAKLFDYFPHVNRIAESVRVIDLKVRSGSFRVDTKPASICGVVVFVQLLSTET